MPRRFALSTRTLWKSLRVSDPPASRIRWYGVSAAVLLMKPALRTSPPFWPPCQPQGSSSPRVSVVARIAMENGPSGGAAACSFTAQPAVTSASSMAAKMARLSTSRLLLRGLQSNAASIRRSPHRPALSARKIPSSGSLCLRKQHSTPREGAQGGTLFVAVPLE